MATQPKLGFATSTGPVECLGLTFESDDQRRYHFLEILAKKLSDPEFRKAEGFPIGKDEDILALSDPPFYTACPNPWIAELTKHFGKPYEPKKLYQREPFAADVSEGKNHPIYNAHSYHTKVPHRAIMRYVLHYTEPGDIIFDGFCGTGMTGVAAQLCADRREVEALGYRVSDSGDILDELGKPFSRLGQRFPILNDLSPAATFIARNYNTPLESSDFVASATEVIKEVEDQWGWIFTTLHKPTEKQVRSTVTKANACTSVQQLREVILSMREPRGAVHTGRINYAVWSDIFLCPDCGAEVNFWEQAVDKSSGDVKDDFPCGSCGSLCTKRGAEKAQINQFDAHLQQPVTQAKQHIALVNYSFQGKRVEKPADDFDQALYKKLSELALPESVASNRMPEGDESRRNDTDGLTHVHHFYSTRNLVLLAALLRQSKNDATKCAILDGHTVGTKMSRFRAAAWATKSTGPMKGSTAGTLYVPSLIGEQNWLNILSEKVSMIKRAWFQASSAVISTDSAATIDVPSNSVDYVFFDPPFGANLMYSELNYLWESWLRVWTNAVPEAIENETQNKDVESYRRLMISAFQNAHRILKPGRWMTVEFSNTNAAIWNAIQTALQEAGFVVANVSALDKQQGSFKAVTTTTAVKQDLVISAYKPNGGLEERFALRGETEEGVWDFVQTHLRHLPVVKAKGGHLEFIVERDPRILYDRMVAFYVRHATPVPLSSAEFLALMHEKFPMRDGMVYLPEQVSEYDKQRAKMEDVGQLAIFVEDEKSAIDWLRGFLLQRPSTYQDIQPEFLQQLSASWKKWETRPELRALLDQNFLCFTGQGALPSQIHSYLSTQFKELRKLPKDDAKLIGKAKERWYVPDPKNAIQVEEVRTKRLLDEFWTYLPTGYKPDRHGNKTQGLPGLDANQPQKTAKKKFKEVRSEAIRVGFKHCFQTKDYPTILAVARELPEGIIEEDEHLQMIYDMAEMRAGGA